MGKLGWQARREALLIRKHPTDTRPTFGDNQGCAVASAKGGLAAELARQYRNNCGEYMEIPDSAANKVSLLLLPLLLLSVSHMRFNWLLRRHRTWKAPPLGCVCSTCHRTLQ